MYVNAMDFSSDLTQTSKWLIRLGTLGQDAV